MENKNKLKFCLVILLLFSSFMTFAQQNEITGKITDESGNGLPGATIVIKGTSNGTSSDIEGNYTLSVPDGAVLTLNYVGYISQEITVGNQSTIDIQLVADVTKLEELVVVGYGSKRKEDIVSAISVVDLEEVKDVPAASVERLLLGQAPGVNVFTNSGRPGQDLDISIRHSLSAIFP